MKNLHYFQEVFGCLNEQLKLQKKKIENENFEVLRNFGKNPRVSTKVSKFILHEYKKVLCLFYQQFFFYDLLIIFCHYYFAKSMF